ncbi:MAG: cytochrome c oxidase subunit 3 [Actinomycetota bacterium]|nr:cytochrome c oxidase subunit 3 [Actinomycetota bacterium]
MGAAGTAVKEAEISASALGMILFISSEVMFFAGLFGAYFTIRATAPEWPPVGVHLAVLLPAIATGVLVASSLSMHRAAQGAERGERSQTSRWLLITIVLGVVFLAGQAYEYSQLGFTVADHAFGTLFYSMTGFHALHVFGGIVTLGLVTIKNARGSVTAERHGPVAAATLYWHFVDVVWVLLFATLYLLR